MAVDPATREGTGDTDRGNHMLKVSETPLNLDRRGSSLHQQGQGGACGGGAGSAPARGKGWSGGPGLWQREERWGCGQRDLAIKEVVPGEKRGRRRMALPVLRWDKHVSRCFGRVSLRPPSTGVRGQLGPESWSTESSEQGAGAQQCSASLELSCGYDDQARRGMAPGGARGATQ